MHQVVKVTIYLRGGWGGGEIDVKEKSNEKLDKGSFLKGT